MATLDGILISGFRSISHAAVNLRPLNVLIGANGSGKSNFISAFSFLRAVNRGQLQDYVGKAGGADRILHFGSKVTSEPKDVLVAERVAGQTRFTRLDGALIVAVRKNRRDPRRRWAGMITGKAGETWRAGRHWPRAAIGIG